MNENKLICGVGINDADYSVFKTEKIDGKWKTVWVCPYYVKWSAMLNRCYGEMIKNKFPTYEGCYTVPEWHYFMNFKGWMETQDWEGKHLDKDLLVRGNRVYGPDTCVFLTAAMNSFVLERQNDRGEWPIGVSFVESRDKFKACCKDSVKASRKNLFLGYFDTPEEAHNAWLKEKLRQAKVLAKRPENANIAQALVERYKNYVEEK